MLRPIAALALVAACHSSKPVESTAPPSNKVIVQTPSAPDDVLAMLPLNSDMILGFEWTTAKQSSLYHQFEAEIIASLGTKLQLIRDRCGFDPMQTIERVTFGGSLSDDGLADGVVVVRGVSGDKTLDCMVTATEGTEVKATTEDGIRVFARGPGKRAAATVLGTTLVMQVSPNASAASLKEILSSGSPLRGSPAFMTLFDRREAGASVWGMINGNSRLLDNMAQAGAKPKSIDGTLVLTDVFTGALRTTYATAGEADNIAKMIQQIVPMASGKVEHVDVHVDAEIVKLNVVATAAQVRALAAMLGGFF